MQHAVKLRTAWRSRLRKNVSLRARRRTRLAGASLVLLVLLVAPAARGAVSGHTASAQRPAGYLGIEFHDLTSEQAQTLHLRDNRGVEVLLVDHDGPGAAAGLKPNDLITGFNGHIVQSGEALRRMIRETGAGVQVTLAVFRSGNPITIRAKLANREDIERKAWQRLTQPEAPPQQSTVVEGFSEAYVAPAPAPAAPAPEHTQSFIGAILHGPFTGAVVAPMTPQLAAYFGASKGEGLLVESVESGSPAAAAGLEAGDVILRANGESMRTSSQWTKQLHASKGKTLTLDLLREHRELSLTLQPEGKH